MGKQTSGYGDAWQDIRKPRPQGNRTKSRKKCRYPGREYYAAERMRLQFSHLEFQELPAVVRLDFIASLLKSVSVDRRNSRGGKEVHPFPVLSTHQTVNLMGRYFRRQRMRHQGRVQTEAVAYELNAVVRSKSKHEQEGTGSCYGDHNSSTRVDGFSAGSNEADTYLQMRSTPPRTHLYSHTQSSSKIYDSTEYGAENNITGSTGPSLGQSLRHQCSRPLNDSSAIREYLIDDGYRDAEVNPSGSWTTRAVRSSCLRKGAVRLPPTEGSEPGRLPQVCGDFGRNEHYNASRHGSETYRKSLTTDVSGKSLSNSPYEEVRQTQHVLKAHPTTDSKQYVKKKDSHGVDHDEPQVRTTAINGSSAQRPQGAETENQKCPAPHVQTQRQGVGRVMLQESHRKAFAKSQVSIVPQVTNGSRDSHYNDQYNGSEAEPPELDEYPEKPLELQSCTQCGRSFGNPISFSKHVANCSKVFQGKRKKFDSMKRRLTGVTTDPTDLIALQKQAQASKSTKDSKMESRWRKQSAQFRAALQLKSDDPAVVAEAEAVLQQSRDEMTSCPHCQRTFSKYAAEKHIPICAKIYRKKADENKKPAHKKCSKISSQNGTKRGVPSKIEDRAQVAKTKGSTTSRRNSKTSSAHTKDTRI